MLPHHLAGVDLVAGADEEDAPVVGGLAGVSGDLAGLGGDEDAGDAFDAIAGDGDELLEGVVHDGLTL